MKIDNIKQLKALIQLCRKTGVHTFTLDGMKLELGAEPVKPQDRVYAEDPMESIQVPQPNIQDPIAMAKAHAAAEMKRVQDYIHNEGELTEEELTFYSAREQVGHETKQ